MLEDLRNFGGGGGFEHPKPPLSVRHWIKGKWERRSLLSRRTHVFCLLYLIETDQEYNSPIYFGWCEERDNRCVLLSWESCYLVCLRVHRHTPLISSCCSINKGTVTNLPHLTQRGVHRGGVKLIGVEKVICYVAHRTYEIWTGQARYV